MRANTIEGAVFAGLLAAPMHAITASALAALACVLGAVSFQPVALQCRAAVLRFALVTDELDLYDARLAEAREHDEALLAPPSHQWISDGVLQRLLRARHSALSLPAGIRDKIKLQSYINTL